MSSGPCAVDEPDEATTQVAENEEALASAPVRHLENTEGDNNKWWSMTQVGHSTGGGGEDGTISGGLLQVGNLTVAKWGQIGDDAEPLFSRIPFDLFGRGVSVEW